ncbi:MAG: DUF4395 domain-containing protein [Deinococcota bacterium]|uniref:DUF4395 domain-containing protein n=1 Tax=Allomeiothermus silvanus (strain ATCC 700542 / DSM 9946 / NBRC 106475 / NCIMB 13440 / VI-R2) TaxID=526227 RepID=D7BAJ7_ALLS1|nr:DUF4395 domain-containing protein [Allomeiothermus silvanus]ADH62519.1 conserved hypothetical protein [Allomeiothermus silvanus DSM 9946]
MSDRNQLRFNQTLLTVLVPGALLLQQPWVVGVLFVLMVSQHLPYDLMALLKRVLRIPRQPVDEDPRPHRFARTVGAVFLGLSGLLFLLGVPVAGWGLAIIVALLAAINLTTGFCLGCFLYFQLRLLRFRLGAR